MRRIGIAVARRAEGSTKAGLVRWTAFLVVGAGALAAAPAAYGGNPIAHWDFETPSNTTVNDVSGNNRHGTLQGGMTTANFVTGKVGNYALQMDGDDDYVQVGTVGLSGNAARTICGWAKASTSSIPDWTGVFGFAPNAWDQNSHFDVEVIGGTVFGLHLYGIEWAFCPVDTTWHHFAATYDGSSTVKLYLDGHLVATQSRSGLATVDNFTIGLRTNNGNNFPGLVDDIRVYNSALSDAEVQALAGMASVQIVQATATDLDDGDTVLSAGDAVFIVFDAATNKALDGATRTGSEMNGLFHLSGGHSWGDESAGYALNWFDSKVLRIRATNVSGATIAIGDTITVDASAGIQNAGGTSTCTATSPPIAGDWGTGQGLPAASGAILVEIWDPILSGNASAVLSWKDPPLPSSAEFSTDGCHGRNNAGDSYNTRIRGFIYPPETGIYYIQVKADDYGEVWLSYDDDPAHARFQISGDWSTAYGTWAEAPAGPAVWLEAGNRYYIEACHKEQGGGDLVEVGWKRPSVPNVEMIPASCLSPPDPAVVRIDAMDPNFDDAIYDAGDTVTIVFNLPTNQSPTCTGALSGAQMNQYFQLGGGHTWGSSTAACNVSWLDARTLLVTVLDASGATVAIGDTLTVTASCGIKVSTGTGSAWQVSGVIGGDWGVSLSDALVLYYDMNETSGTQVTDHSGNNYHGTLVGVDLEAGGSVQGQVGRAIQFVKTGDYVECGNPALLGSMSEYTIALWVRPNDTSTAGYGLGDTIVAKEGDGNGFHLTWDQEGTGYRFGAMFAGIRMVWTAADKQNGVWYHVAAVWNPNEGATIYVDGAVAARDPGARYNPNATATMRIACFGTGGSADDVRTFQGTIDELRIYSVALTQEMVQAICASTVVSIQATDATAKEGASPETGTFTVTRTALAYPELTVKLDLPQGAGYANHPHGSPADYDLAASGGAALAYNAGTGAWTLTFPVSVRTVTITLTPIDDSEIEAPENATITIQSGAAYTVAAGQGSATVVIQDDDVPGSFAAVSPADESTEVSLPVTLQWQAAANATYYSVSLAITDIVTGQTSQQNYANVGNVTSYAIPGGVLTENMRVDWTVTAYNAAGGTPMNNAPWTFYTPDTYPPRVTGSLPSAGSDRLKISDPVRVYFSEPMDPTTTLAAVSMMDELGAPVTGTASLSADGRTLTFDPAGRLAYNTLYTITIARTAEDLAGNRLDGNANGTGGEATDDVQISFRTEKELPGLGAQVEGCGAPGGPGSSLPALLLLGALAMPRRRPKARSI